MHCLEGVRGVRVIKRKCRKLRLFPPERLPAWRDALLEESKRSANDTLALLMSAC